MSHYWIVGHGGIGSAIADTLMAHNHQVTIVSRRPVSDRRLSNQIKFDVTDPDHDSRSELTQKLTTDFPDYVINTVGILHDDNHYPEKAIDQVDDDWLLYNFRVNTLATVHLAQCLQQCMTRETALKFLVISARVGSIADNRFGGWYSYRMSKAALNMLIKNIALEWGRRHKKSAIYAYQPGTVDTPLSKPFQKNVPQEQLFSPQTAAHYLLEVLCNKLTVGDSGKLFDWHGQAIPY